MTPSRRLTGQQMIRKHTTTTDLCIQNQHMTTRECHSGTIQMHSAFSRRISQQANINQETKSKCQRSCGNQGLEYQVFELDVFRDHIYQERRL
jgi:Tfp pilus assembly PilM family ATPase